MLQLSKKVDYALIALMHLAQQGDRTSWSAREIAAGYGMPQDLLAKILQKLAREGIVASQQGTKGGYSLAHPATAIDVVRVIEAVDGPFHSRSALPSWGTAINSIPATSRAHCTV